MSLLAAVSEKNGEISCSVEESNRVRALLGLRPLDVDGVGNGSGRNGGSAPTATGTAIQPVRERNGEIRCSVEETNRVRAALGLKLLVVNDDKGKNADISTSSGRGGTEEKRSSQKERARLAQAEEIAERIERSRKRRKLAFTLTGATLGDETEKDGGGAADWIARSRKTLDVSLANTESGRAKEVQTRVGQYSSKDLEGTRVSHDLTTLRQGDVLTLKDTSLIDDETGHLAGDVDELENSRVAAVSSEERAMKRKRKMAKGPKSARTGGNSSNELLLEHEQEIPEDRPILGKYDAVLEDEGLVKKKPRLSAAVLGSDGIVSANNKVASQDQDSANRHAGSATGHRPHESLDSVLGESLEKTAEGREATRALAETAHDFYTAEEFDILQLQRQAKKSKKTKKDKKEKKPKKDKSHKRSKKLDDDKRGEEKESDEDDPMPIVRDSKKKKRIKRQRQEEVQGHELAQADLLNNHSLLVCGPTLRQDSVSSIARAVKYSEDSTAGPQEDDSVVFSSTAGFASAIQNRIEQRLEERATESKDKGERTTPVILDVDKQDDQGARDEKVELKNHASSSEKERDRDLLNADKKGDAIGDSVADALQYLARRGDIRPKAHAPAANSSVIVGRAKDAKPILDDGKGGFVLEYRDELGRLMTPQEAFRQESYAFHGHEQRPGLKKQAKRLRELDRQKAQTFPRK